MREGCLFGEKVDVEPGAGVRETLEVAGQGGRSWGGAGARVKEGHPTVCRRAALRGAWSRLLTVTLIAVGVPMILSSFLLGFFWIVRQIGEVLFLLPCLLSGFLQHLST